LRILLINLVFFMTSSSLCGVRRFPSRISLMMSLTNYHHHEGLTSSIS